MSIDMAGLDWGSGPAGGIYLMGHDTSESQVRRGGGGMMGSQKIRGWAGGRFIPGDCKTAAEAIKLTGLDWEVDQRPVIRVEPIYGVPTEDNPSGIIGWEPQHADEPPAREKRRQGYTLPTCGYAVAESHVQNVRRDTGKVLGVVGPGWSGPPNSRAFSFLDDLVDDDEAKFIGGGEQDGGKRVWIATQFRREVLLGGDANERCLPLGFFSNGWDGTLAFTITVAPFRLACSNGQTIPLEGYVRTWRARHTTTLAGEERLQEARRTLALSIGYFDAWTEAMERLMTKKISTQRVEKLITQLFPDPAPAAGKTEPGDRAIKNVDKKRHALLDVYREADDLQHLGHTAYRFLNAVTAYADWGGEGQTERQMVKAAEPSKLKDAAYVMLAHA